MDAVLRGVSIYVALLVIMRLSGRRTLGQMNAFDFVLLLIIGECTQQALLGEDFSITNSIILILTLVMMDIGLAFVKARLPRLDKALDGVPTVLVEDGEPLYDRMKMARVDEADILENARLKQGLASMREIRFAVLERTGDISIIPKRD